MRDALGFSRQQAKRFMAIGFKGLFDQRDADAEIADALKDINAYLKR